MRIKALCLIAAVGLAPFGLAAPALAQQAPTLNIRGVIANVEADALVVRTADGASRTVALPADVPVAVTRPFTMADVRTGMMLGVTTVVRDDGQIVAVDVRPIPPTARAGLSPYDLRQGATMTNASLEANVESSSGRELVLNYKEGVVKVLVTSETTMSQSAPGTRTDLKAGETAYVAARAGADGTLTAVRVQVSKDGVKPTQ